MRLLLGYFLIVAIAAWFVLSIFVQEVKPGVRRATEGTLNDTATLLAALAREDLLAANPQQGRLAQAFQQLNQLRLNANIGGIKKVRNEYRVYLTDARGKVVFDSSGEATGPVSYTHLLLGIYSDGSETVLCADGGDPRRRVER